MLELALANLPMHGQLWRLLGAPMPA